VIIVDDNSPDGTQEVARQLAATYGEDKIVLKPAKTMCCGPATLASLVAGLLSSRPSLKNIMDTVYVVDVALTAA
jgi:glycosyltransferase involved in cell wall biosynthesis